MGQKRYREIYGVSLFTWGVPRFQKIDYFFKNILKRDISLDDIDILAKRFAKIIEKNVFDRKNLIEDTLKFIEQNL